MAGVLYHVVASSALVSLGIYNLINTTRNHLKSPRDYSAKPYHPFPAGPQRLRHLQLYLLLLFLFLALLHQTFVAFESDPLLKGRTPVHRFTSLQSSAVLLLFLLLSAALLLSESTSLLPLPPDLLFSLSSAAFFLQFSVSSSSSSVQTSDLQAQCDSVSARISALSSLLCLALALHPKLFLADAALAGSLCLQGLWILQTGLSLRVEMFIPEGCHQLLDVVSGVEGSTKCDLEDSKLRAIAILDLVFLVHSFFVIVLIVAVYAVVARSVGGIRRLGSYEALPPAELKTISGTQA